MIFKSLQYEHYCTYTLSTCCYSFYEIVVNVLMENQEHIVARIEIAMNSITFHKQPKLCFSLK